MRLIADGGIRGEPLLQKFNFSLIDHIVCNEATGDADQLIDLSAGYPIRAYAIAKKIIVLRSFPRKVDCSSIPPLPTLAFAQVFAAAANYFRVRLK